MSDPKVLAEALGNIEKAIERGLICRGMPKAAKFAVCLETRLVTAGLSTGHQIDAINRANEIIQQYAPNL